MRTIAKITATAAVTLAAGLSLAACGVQPPVRPASSDVGVAATATQSPATPAAATAPAPAAAPVSPDATTILTGDGYTLTMADDKAAIDAQFGDAAPYVTSAAVGSTGSQDADEVVVVMSASGVALAGGEGGIAALLEAEMPGVTVTVAPSGTSDVLRFTGPASAFSSS